MGADEKPEASWEVGWDNVLEVLGDMMKPVGVYPERWRVTHFPSEDQVNVWGQGPFPQT